MPFAYRVLGRKNSKIAVVPFITESRLLRARFICGGVTPFLSAFWPFWVKVAQTGGFLGPPWECKVLKKSVTYPWGGVSSEATWRVYLCTRDTVRTKYTRAHPPRIGYAVLQYLALQGAPGFHRFGPLWPKMVKKRSKRGYPLF